MLDAGRIIFQPTTFYILRADGWECQEIHSRATSPDNVATVSQVSQTENTLTGSSSKVSQTWLVTPDEVNEFSDALAKKGLSLLGHGTVEVPSLPACLPSTAPAPKRAPLHLYRRSNSPVQHFERLATVQFGNLGKSPLATVQLGNLGKLGNLRESIV